MTNQKKKDASSFFSRLFFFFPCRLTKSTKTLEIKKKERKWGENETLKGNEMGKNYKDGEIIKNPN